MRLLLLACSLSFALAAAAAADPDSAPETMPAAAPLAVATPPATEEAKKSPSPSPEAKPNPKAQADEIRKTADTYFKQCLEDWDAATHMTKREWERTCRRVVQSRTKFMLDQLGK